MMFMRFREACVGFVMFVFHELVKNLMRKVRVLVGLCIDQLHEVML